MRWLRHNAPLRMPKGEYERLASKYVRSDTRLKEDYTKSEEKLAAAETEDDRAAAAVKQELIREAEAVVKEAEENLYSVREAAEDAIHAAEKELDEALGKFGRFKECLSGSCWRHTIRRKVRLMPQSRRSAILKKQLRSRSPTATRIILEELKAAKEELSKHRRNLRRQKKNLSDAGI